MSINISVRNIVKKYGDTTVIPGLSTEIKAGEFFTLLGPSGCGKTTLLRMIAGFNSIEMGDIYFNETRINDIDPSKRRIGMVFQNYAIFPHLSVRKNVEFGLRNMKVPKKEIRDRAQEYIDIVQIDRWADAMPDRLSGGQQQRVALARALVTSPDVLLMDEPLSNLDAKLRVEMREAIRDIQRRVGITTVYVTHDQEEAMAVSDRIAVMREGVIQQLGTPPELYHLPSNEYVSTFIGRSNVFSGQVVPEHGTNEIYLAGQVLPLGREVRGGDKPQDVRISIRPEQIEVHRDSAGGIPAVVSHSVFLGRSTQYMLKLSDGSIVEAEQDSGLERPLAEGTPVHLEINTSKINIFDAQGERNLFLARGAGVSV